MGDNSRSHSQDLFHILGFGSICKACKSLISKCFPEKKTIFFKKMGNITKPKSTQEDNKTNRYKNQTSLNRKSDRRNDDIGLNSPKASFRRRSCDDHMKRSPQWSPPVQTSPLSRTASHGPSTPFMRSTSRKMAPTRASLLRTMSMSQRNSVDASSASAFPRAFSRSASRTGSTPILYTNSNGLMKPPAMEQQLDCTLEELCFGCVKKIKITRDAITDIGQIVEEDEVFTIKVKPGWKRGTKITFEGMGSEIPGTDPADVIFTIAENKHPTFTRQEDDLELGVKISLVEALTGCSLPIQLLGGQIMNLTIDDVIHPGYKKIIAGQGMPKQNDPTTRGNLIVTFSIKFPKELTEEQRSDAANILQHAC
ncbi:hypothetical protein DH2020_033906 [Rehmannia glutinosa]|uniref:Chaperone DnaJ C-terminal domain-containing protein n=1 Tax=Rehmannia glutinosa TaxID=99300 RepID=A0ABR0VDE3_REHGL